MRDRLAPMADDPYRPSPAEPSAELAKLAAEGSARMRAAKPAKPVLAPDRKGDQLRAALGDRYFSPLRVVGLSAVALGVLLVVAAVVAWPAGRDGSTGEAAAIGIRASSRCSPGSSCRRPMRRSARAPARSTLSGDGSARFPSAWRATSRRSSTIPRRSAGWTSSFSGSRRPRCRATASCWASGAPRTPAPASSSDSGDTVRVRSGTIVSPATQLRVFTIYRNTRIPSVRPSSGGSRARPHPPQSSAGARVDPALLTASRQNRQYGDGLLDDVRGLLQVVS